jgi:hypothetical protein
MERGERERERDFKMLCVDSMRGMKKFNEGSVKLHFSPYNI